MPRYFFYIRDANGTVPDDEGTDCAALPDAVAEAEASARDLAKQFMDDRKSLADIHVDIVDAGGAVVATLPVMETVENPRAVRYRDIPNDNVHRGAFDTALERAEGENRRRKLVIAAARAILDARDAGEDHRWSLELAALSPGR